MMETKNQEKSREAPRNSNRWLYIALVILALGIIGLSVWLISVKNEVSSLRTEKEAQRFELQNELDSIVSEHMKVKEAYGELSDSLVSMDSVFQANAKEIKQLLNYKWEYYKVQKKLTGLQKVAQGYVRKMDSIVTVNQVLTDENIQMKEEIKVEQRKYKNLEQAKGELEDMVDEASYLGIYKLTATPVRVKGSGNETPTDKIRRTDRITVCFTVGTNSLLEPGERTIYVRIAQPDKEILAKGRGDKYTFTYQGEVLQYSEDKQINYQNEAMDLCVRYNIRDTQELQVGLYHVDLFEGDKNIGHTTFELK
jgi:hypothetical protein